METIIHSVKKVTVSKVHELKSGSEITYVRDIIITSENEQLMITVFADEAKDFVPEILT